MPQLNCNSSRPSHSSEHVALTTVVKLEGTILGTSPGLEARRNLCTEVIEVEEEN
jgi:hypothetical protein